MPQSTRSNRPTTPQTTDIAPPPHTNGNTQHVDAHDDGSDASLSPLQDISNDAVQGLGVSKKRKLSDIQTPESKKIIKKESPPWKKPHIEGPSAVITADGRRVSMRVVSLAEPPSLPSVKRVSRDNGQIRPKRPIEPTTPNRSNELHSLSRSARVSPPWKPITAEGPTTLIIDGRRKSGRTIKLEEGEDTQKRKAGKLSKSQKKDDRKPAFKSHPDTSKLSRRLSVHTETRLPKASSIRRLRPSKEEEMNEKHEKLHRNHEKGRLPRTSIQPKEEHATKLRIRVRGVATLHQHVHHFTKPKAFETFAEWLAKDDPLEGEGLSETTDAIQREAATRLNILAATEADGVLSDARCTKFKKNYPIEIEKKFGLPDHIANHATYFAKLQKQESIKHRAEAKALAKAAEIAIAVDPRWAFLQEAKSADELFKEQYGYQKKRYVQLMKDLMASWALVRGEVDRIKLKQWQEEQDVLGKRHLDEMLDKHKIKLQEQLREPSTDFTSEMNDSRRQSVALDDSETISDEDSDSAASSEAEEDDENLSESSDEEEEEEVNQADDDQGLTQEELREKYAIALEQDAPFSSEDEESGGEEDDNLLEDMEEDNQNIDEDDQNNDHEEDQQSRSTASPTLCKEDIEKYQTIVIEEVDSDLLDDTDNSTDMDTGDSDGEDEDDEADSGDESDATAEEVGASGLAGFLFSKNELLEAKQTTEQDDNESDNQLESFQEDSHGATSNLHIDGHGRSSDRCSEINTGTASTPDQDAAVSTPTTSIIPATPRRTRTEVSPLLRGTLREYQHDGVDWLANLYSGGRNGILADEMGLGKTIQTIALLAHLATHHHIWGPHLVVVPTSVMLNWEMEFKKFCPSFKILNYYGDIAERRRKRKGWNNDDLWNVCITSYNIILQDQQVFKRRQWHYLVLDEAHNIKNFQSQRWQTLLTFRTHSRLLLTGTPLQNNLQELWSLLYFLMPADVDGGGFADLEKFLNTMKRPADQILDQGREELDPEAQSRVSKLHEILRPFLLRRLKADVEKQMPSKYEHVVYCRLSKRQRQLYDEFMGRQDTKKTLSSGNYMSIINCLMSLRKVCNHPDLFETRQIVTSFAMPKSVVASYEIKELTIRRRLLSKESFDLDFSGLLPASYETNRRRHVARLARLQASNQLQRLANKEMARLEALEKDEMPGTQSVIRQMRIEAQKGVVGDLLNRAEHVKRVTDRAPIYGADLIDLVMMPNPLDPLRPNRKRPEYTWGSWFLDKSTTIAGMLPTTQEISVRSTELIAKFSCVTPAVVAEDVLECTLTGSGRKLIQEIQDLAPAFDPYHEPRIRQSIAFPDKRLLQFDCGKLQALDKLLRDLQAGGHRCLIFTQMTRVLDILEQFLNIHGHKYLRLDGSTKVEQRQILTDRFNKDTRILAFILSSRSGGLGINLTGADTVIFYDLDWNPAMDKQCQDRCHRIGQTRDVHIYRFVSEYTIEANILRKSNQKRLLDDVIIQRGDFTTDMFQKVTYKDALEDMEDKTGADATTSAALDKFLGKIGEMGNALDNVEDKEDAAAAKIASKEAVVDDAVDFDENTAAAKASAMAANPNAAADDTVDGTAADNDELPHVDEYMLRFMIEDMKYDPVRLAKPAAPKNRKRIPRQR